MKWLVRPGLRMALVMCFMTFLLAVMVWINVSRPRIVVLHALSAQAAWTQDIQQGLQARLLSNRLPVVVEHTHMNLDLLSRNADITRVSEDIRRRMTRTPPDVLIAVDDEANAWVARHFTTQKKPQIVYAGVMMPPSHYGYEADSGIVGLQEQLPLHGISEFLSHAFPGQSKRVAILGASTLTGSIEMAQALDHDWKPHKIVAHASVHHFQDWKAFVAGPGLHADILIVLSTDTVRSVHDDQTMTDEAEVIAWTESHANPLPVGVRDAYVRKGGGLAISTPAYELGANAMELALGRIGNTAGSSARLALQPLAYDVSIRQSVLDQRQLAIPSIYVQAARMGHKFIP